MTKTVTSSSTQDMKTKVAVETKLDREEKRQLFISKHSSSSPTPTPASTSWAGEVLEEPILSSEPSPNFHPKRACPEKPSGTTLHLPKNIMSVIGHIADREGISNMQACALTAGIVNHCDGDIDNLSLSKSTARRHRATSRSAKVCAHAYIITFKFIL